MSRGSVLRRFAFAFVPAIGLMLGVEGGLAAYAAWVDYRAGMVGHHAAPGTTSTVVCAGDSVTRGVPGPVEESYPTRLGERLPGTDVVNLGRPGSPTQDALQRVRDMAAPADGRGVTVVWLAGFNNCAELKAVAAAVPVTAPPPPWLDWINRTRTVRLLAQVAARVRPAVSTPPPPDDPRRERCTAAVRGGVQQIREQTRLRGWPLLVLTYPLPAHPTPGVPESNWITPTANDAVRAQAQYDKTPLLDTVPCMQAAEAAAGPLVALYTADELHLTRSGYTALAACVAEGLALAR